MRFYEELELLGERCSTLLTRVDQLAGRVDRLTALVEQLAARIAGVELAHDADT